MCMAMHVDVFSWAFRELVLYNENLHTGIEKYRMQDGACVHAVYRQTGHTL